MGKCYLYGSCKGQTAGCVVRPDNGCPVYRYFKDLIVKDQYEQRLKADMVAMLTDIQLEIEELKNEPACCHHFVRGIRRSSEVIQQKIDVLKVDKE